ncbi:hypothetical protein ACP4OV_005941 [Aristida adscensionis]
MGDMVAGGGGSESALGGAVAEVRAAGELGAMDQSAGGELGDEEHSADSGQGRRGDGGRR